MPPISSFAWIRPPGLFDFVFGLLSPSYLRLFEFSPRSWVSVLCSRALLAACRVRTSSHILSKWWHGLTLIFMSSCSEVLLANVSLCLSAFSPKKCVVLSYISQHIMSPRCVWFTRRKNVDSKIWNMYFYSTHSTQLWMYGFDHEKHLWRSWYIDTSILNITSKRSRLT